MKDILECIKSRRSVRDYLKDVPTDEEIKQIVEAGRYAPSAMNQQPRFFSVVRDPEILKRLSESCRLLALGSSNQEYAKKVAQPGYNAFHHAPLLMVVAADKNALEPRKDATLALQNMMVAGHFLGLGSCWINAVEAVLNAPDAGDERKELGIPDNYLVYGGVVFGYPKDSPDAPERHEKMTIIG